MAVSVDTIYQRVLAIANKEQRGYITPQEFNLFANQAQMEIFEQYFYDRNQINRLPSNDTPYADPVHLLEEKISIFKKRHQAVRVINQFGDCLLPTDIYRLDSVVRFALTGESETSQKNIEEISENDLGLILGSPLAKPNKKRPVYLRKDATSIKVYPFSSTPSASAVWYFTNDQVVTTNSNANITVNNNIANYDFLEIGAYVYAIDTPSDLAVPTVIDNIVKGSTTTAITLSNAGGSSFGSSGYELAFASPDIYCNYVRKPATVKWTYNIINKKALYNSSAADLQNFELHVSEENNLLVKILQLAGISFKDTFLAQTASQKEVNTQNQQKQ